MNVLILEENLMWSSRLKSGVTGLGHNATVVSSPLESFPLPDVAIVNLGSRAFAATEWIPKLQSLGSKVIAHAGHKEKPLLLVGTDSGADVVVTNSELTNKLESVFARL